MGARDQIGKAKARAGLAVARNIGVAISLSHRGAAGVSLKAEFLGEEIGTIEEGSILYEARIISLGIPVQTNFAYSSTQGEPITPGDTITLFERVHEVLQPIDKGTTGRVYKIRMAQWKRLKQG